MAQCKRDIVMFLGAGFSRDAGLPTMEIFGQESERELEAQNNLIKKRNASKMLHDAGTTFKGFQEFCNSASSYVKVETNNMEEIFCIAEAMHEANIQDLTHLNITMDELLIQIKLWLWKIYHKCPVINNVGKSEPYKDFVGLLKDNKLSEKLTVLTTNYDLVFEHSAWKAGIPCKYPNFKNVKTFTFFEKQHEEYIAPNNNNTAALICKLHGSINYFHTQGESDNPSYGNKNDMLFISKEIAEQGDNIGKSDFGNVHAAIFAVDAICEIQESNESLIPAIVPPTYTKLKGYSWLRDIWYEAFNAIENAKTLIFIGYSMPDSDGFMRALFQGAMANRKKTKSLQVYVIDPHATPSCDLGKRYQEMFSPLKNKDLEFIPKTFAQAMKEGLLKKLFSEVLSVVNRGKQ